MRYALERVEHLLIVLYPCIELPWISLSTRANWIRTCFADVSDRITVIEAIDGPMDSGYSERVIQIQDRFLRQLLAPYAIDAFFCSEAYGKHVSLALDCRDIRVDMARKTVPISATQIRDNPTRYRHFLSTHVVKDLIQKIVFLGAPSTGKSTLCEALAQRLSTVWVEEYGREYWLEHQVDRRLSPEQLLHIGQTQNAWEDEKALQANRFLLCDTNAFTTWHFALHYHNSALPELEKLARDSWQRYQLVVLCDDDIPYDDTWERSGDANRAEFQQFLRDYLQQHQIHHIVVQGPLEKRIETVLEAMSRLTESKAIA